MYGKIEREVDSVLNKILVEKYRKRMEELREQEEQRLIDDLYENNEEEWFDDFYYDDM